jgi:hypothetical protein
MTPNAPKAENSNGGIGERADNTQNGETLAGNR